MLDSFIPSVVSMLHDVDFFPEKDRYRTSKKLSSRPTIHSSAHIRKSKIGSWTEIGPHCHFNEVVFDDYSYVAGYVSIAYSKIGKFCSIANSVRINPGNHPMERVTQHHCTYRRRQYGFADTEDEDFFQWRRDHNCVIGHDVWIGHGAIVLPGVTIGHGAIIGAGAVVTKDVAPYEVVVGVPTQKIKHRFPPAIAEKLIEIAWWDWDHQLLTERFDDLSNVEKFIEKYGK